VKDNSSRKSSLTVAGSFRVIRPRSSTIISATLAKVDKTVNFHGLRHGIANAFRNAGYLDEQFNMLLGHTKATTTGRDD
jgi:site-specific recombinase XerD